MTISRRASSLAVLITCFATLPHAQQRPPTLGLAGRIDHAMFPGGPELSRLVEILRDRLELPVVIDGPRQTPSMPGICVSFGNMCLEVVPLPNNPNDPPPAARLGSLALEARHFGTLIDSLKAREIDHFPPAPQTRWTTIGLRGLGGGTFFIEYHTGMAQRRQLFRGELDKNDGGRLGIIRMIELSRSVDAGDRDTVAMRLTRLFGAPLRSDANLWSVGDGPAVRLVSRDDSHANRVVVEVRSLPAAAQALRSLGLPFVQTKTEIAIDAVSMLGLSMVLRQTM
jgi:hypothetical protein